MTKTLQEKWRRGKAKTAFLVLLAVFFLGAYYAAPAWSGGAPKGAQGDAAVGPL